jgi:hypothetical protein
MAEHCGSFVADGGVLVITCIDTVSVVSETLRCLLGWLLVRDVEDYTQQVAALAEFFGDHLEHLKNVTRSVEDWVMDNVLQTYVWRGSPLFSIPEAIEVLGGSYFVHGTSPGFLQDWSWYKSVGDIHDHFNSTMGQAYWENAHNLIDWRVVSKPRSRSENLELERVCRKIRLSVEKVSDNPALFGELVSDLDRLADVLPKENVETRTAISSYTAGMQNFLQSGVIASEMFEDFGAWWGRGTQYCSFVKQ